MLPFLRLFLMGLWAACVAGACITAALALGYVDVGAFVWSGIAGLVIGVPAGLLNWVYLRPNRSRQIGWTWPVADWVRGLAQKRAARHSLP